MPRCQDCPYLEQGSDGPECSFGNVSKLIASGREIDGRVENNLVLRSCIWGMLNKHADRFEGDILEVGYGAWKGTRRFLRGKKIKVNRWHGLDPKAPDDPSRRLYKGTVSDIPTDDCTFDWVIAFSTMEHWCEFGDSLESGLQEIHRVLKPGGMLLLEAPMFVHGDERFHFGEVNVIKRIVMGLPWDVQFEEWRKDHFPLEPVYGWDPKFQRAKQVPEYEQRALKMEQNFSVPPSSWHLEIFCSKR